MDDRPAQVHVSQEPGLPPLLTVDGIDVAGQAGIDPTEQGLQLVVEEARRSGAPVRVILRDDRDVRVWRLVVHPDGSVVDDPGPPRTVRRPVRRAALVALAAALLLGGVAYAVNTRAPVTEVVAGPTPTPLVPLSPVTPTLLPTPSASPPVAVPLPSVTPVPVPAAPVVHVAAPVARPPAAPVAVPTPAPAPAVPVPAVPAPAAPTPLPAAVTPTPTPRPTVAPLVVTAAPVPTTALADATGQCLTAAGAAVSAAACDRSVAQAWSYGDGQLRHAGLCLTYGDGLALADCSSTSAHGWTASDGTTTNAGMCLETVGGRPTLTQCGTGRAVVLTAA